MDSRDNRGKAKQTSEECSKDTRFPNINIGTEILVGSNNCNLMLTQFASSQHQHLETTSDDLSELTDMQFIQQFQMPSMVGSSSFVPPMTEPPAYNHMQIIPNYNISHDVVGGYRNYQQQSCNNTGSLVLAGTSTGPLLQSIVPTVEDYKDMLLDDRYQEVESWITNIRQSWSLTGCSIILDGWNDEITGSTMMNVLVDNPLGIVYLHTYDVTFPSAADKVPLIEGVIENVICELRPENVIQVISNTASPLLKEVKRRIEAKYQSMHWNISATSCLVMMLQKVASSLKWVRDTIEQAKTITRFVQNSTMLLFLFKSNIGKNEDCDLVKYAKVREATPFMTLENLLRKREYLAFIFASALWTNSCEGSSIDGKNVATLVASKPFWEKVSLIVQGGMPIVNAINLFNHENGPLMGLLYETIDQVKETIREQIGYREAKAFWKIIDNIWNDLLHSPLHAAGSYLNPSLFYVEDFGNDSEVMRGLMDTIAKLSNPYTQDLIKQQLKTYEQAHKGFARGVAERDNFSPVDWWKQFGRDCPELQSFATKVLGLSCNGASTYGLRRVDVERLNSMNGSILKVQRLMKDRFVSYNCYLRELRESKMKFDMEALETNPNDDWIVAGNN